MNLSIDWYRPILLYRNKREKFGYTMDLDKIPEECAGIYIFARKHGTSYEALYVGKSVDVYGRVKGHFNNLNIMRHLENAKNGQRVLIVGEAITKRGQNLEKALRTIERGMIRHFLSEGHDLANKQGTKLKRHEITSSGPVPKAFVPSLMFLEKK